MIMFEYIIVPNAHVQSMFDGFTYICGFSPIHMAISISKSITPAFMRLVDRSRPTDRHYERRSRYSERQMQLL